MRRLFAPAVAAVLLAAACGPAAASQTPQKALSAAASKLEQTKSVHVSVSGTTHIRLPPELLQAFLGGATPPPGAGIPLEFTVPIEALGDVQFPARAHLTVMLSFQGQPQTVEVIDYDGSVYVRARPSDKWMVLPGQYSMLQGGPAGDPLSAAKLFAHVKSAERLDDTTVDGTPVEHYRFVPDFSQAADDLLKALKANGTPFSPQAETALRETLAGASGSGEAFVGRKDQLVRRLTESVKFPLDLRDLLQSLAGQPGVPPLPANLPPLKLQAEAAVTTNFSNFNAAVTITRPTT